MMLLMNEGNMPDNRQAGQATQKEKQVHLISQPASQPNIPAQG
jgi:hypothetical protein